MSGWPPRATRLASLRSFVAAKNPSLTDRSHPLSRVPFRVRACRKSASDPECTRCRCAAYRHIGDGRGRRRAERYLCGVVRQGLLCGRLRADGVGQGGAPAAQRGRTILTIPRAGADFVWAGRRRRGGSLGYLGARRTWCRRLQQSGSGVPRKRRARSASVLYGRPARKLAGTLVAGADRGGNS